MWILSLAWLACQDALTLSDQGRSEYRIVIAKDAIPSEKYAAEEFQRFFKQMSGAELPIVSEAEPEGTHEIRLNARVKEKPELKSDGFILRTTGRHLAIIGTRPRGTLYGVYELLEEHLGCRWFTRTVSRIPKKERWELKPIDRTCSPTFEYREVHYFGALDVDWAARQRTNGWFPKFEARHGNKVEYYAPFVHTFEAILPCATHFAQHPEYYSEIKGKRTPFPTQLCLTNPDVLRITIETVKRWMKEQPNATIFSVSQNDCFNNCQCANCRAIDEAEGSPIGSILTFVNKVAEAVEKEFPGKLIDTIAYRYSQKAPKTLRPRPNVRIRLCSIECCFVHPFEECPQNKAFVADMKDWSKFTDQIYVWDYCVTFGHYLMPFANFDSLGPNVKFFAAHGVKGLFEQGANYGEGHEMAELRAYILAKLVWNPDYDVKKAIEEFTEAVYGEAAPTIREYLELLQNQVRNKPVHGNIWSNPNSAYLGKGFLEKAEAIFDAGQAQVKDPGALKALRQARLCIDYLRFMRTRRTDPEFAQKRDKFFAALDEFKVTYTSEGGSAEDFKKRFK